MYHSNCKLCSKILPWLLRPNFEGWHNTENTKIIDYNNNWAHLQYFETYHIKTLSAEIDVGLKASKELILFK